MDDVTLKSLRVLILDDENNTDQDALLRLVYSQSKSKLLSILNTLEAERGEAVSASLPASLDWAVLEMTCERHNRIGSEGMRSEAVEGHSIAFDTDDFTRWRATLSQYLKPKPDGKAKPGRVIVYGL